MVDYTYRGFCYQNRSCLIARLRDLIENWSFSKDIRDIKDINNVDKDKNDD